jgi:hypothetical protein
MTNLDILFLVVITGLSILLAVFQYTEELKKKEDLKYLFVALRSLIFIVIGLLLLDLSITSTSTNIIKPRLAILADNSSSMKDKISAKQLEDKMRTLSQQKDITERFFTNIYQFGEAFKKLDTLNLNDNKTNIQKGLSTLSDLYPSNDIAIVLLSDGHQNYGPDFAHYARNRKMKIYPVAIGDTASYKDLSVDRINHNDYTYLGNEFPVEILVNYEGDLPVKSQINISNNKKLLFSKKLSFDKDKRSAIINAKIKTKKAGLRKYQVKLKPIDDEKNTSNNETSFQIEVIDDQLKVLLLSSIIHPDLGALKRSIETNERQQVIIKTSDEFKGNLDDYESIILYQPNRRLISYLSQLENKNASLLIIGGEKTDYRSLSKELGFFNKQNDKKTEDFQGVYNKGFKKFQFDNLGFSNFPPLSDQFGDVEISGEHNILLYKSVNGIKTEAPLLFEKEQGNRKFIFLLGEGIWKWRGEIFRQRESFRPFDRFLDKWVQYLNVDEKERLEVDAKRSYRSGSNGKVIARYYDANYEFDPRAKLKIRVKKSDGQEKVFDMPLINDRFTFDINNLSSGTFSYEVFVEGQSFQETGSFNIEAFTIENKQYGANVEQLLSASEDDRIYTLNSFNELQQELLKDEMFQPVQKSTQNKKSLINWYYLLVLLIVFLGLEWFIRKYNGLI